MLLTMEPSRVLFYILVSGGYTGSYILQFKELYNYICVMYSFIRCISKKKKSPRLVTVPTSQCCEDK